MCELLVFALEVDHPHHYRVGDVLQAKPDGAPWGMDELKSGSSFRVLSFPGVAHERADSLVEHVIRTDTVKRRRYYRLDVSHPSLTSGFRDWWDKNDGTKFVVNVPMETLTMATREA